MPSSTEDSIRSLSTTYSGHEGCWTTQHPSSEHHRRSIHVIHRTNDVKIREYSMGYDLLIAGRRKSQIRKKDGHRKTKSAYSNNPTPPHGDTEADPLISSVSVSQSCAERTPCARRKLCRGDSQVEVNSPGVNRTSSSESSRYMTIWILFQT
ncbi:hypothetical protein Pst134EB_002107 [Puccinia striiformis f. sp. tritici]|nr:hypothetical protein Pst134EB_002107 [Puccinia striiformis f. sp. tritici]